MKSIKQQYIDLQEGNMSQANFMRNLRMTLPQFVTNVTSYEDSVRILKNKGILTEADTKSSEGKYKKVTGKDLYDHFKEVDNLNGHEILQGIDWEMEKNHELTKEEATKIVIKNLKKNPIYYTSWDLSGVEGYEPETMGPKADIEARKMQYLEKNMGNVVDKKMGMKPVKDVEKVKKDSDKGGETNKMEKGISLMSLVAKTVRGVKKMDPTGEKMKKVTVKENKTFNKKLTKERLMQMIQEELAEIVNDSPEIYEDFNDWLIALSDAYSKNGGIKSELREIGIDASTATADDLIVAIKKKAGPDRNYFLSFSIRDESDGEKEGEIAIRVGHSFKTYGKWNTTTNKGIVNPVTPPLNVYPSGPGSITRYD